jgi:Ca-activated chloride channel family protein
VQPAAPVPAPSAGATTALAPVEGLRDIAMPPAVKALPPAPGWYLVGLVLLAVAFWGYRQHQRARTASRYRHEALAELEGIVEALQRPGGRHELAARLPPLLKRVALHVEPRSAVAALTGPAWLAELDRLYHGNEWSKGPGKILPRLAYGSAAALSSVPRADIDALVRLSRDFIKQHHAPRTAPGPAGGTESA